MSRHRMGDDCNYGKQNCTCVRSNKLYSRPAHDVRPSLK